MTHSGIKLSHDLVEDPERSQYGRKSTVTNQMYEGIPQIVGATTALKKAANVQRELLISACCYQGTQCYQAFFSHAQPVTRPETIVSKALHKLVQLRVQTLKKILKLIGVGLAIERLEIRRTRRSLHPEFPHQMDDLATDQPLRKTDFFRWMRYPLLKVVPPVFRLEVFERLFRRAVRSAFQGGTGEACNRTRSLLCLTYPGVPSCNNR